MCVCVCVRERERERKGVACEGVCACPPRRSLLQSPWRVLEGNFHEVSQAFDGYLRREVARLARGVGEGEHEGEDKGEGTLGM